MHGVIAGLAALATTWPVLALDPDRDVSQYLVDRWGVERGYVGGAVHAITQSADGHLWIGADKGLVRFDGLTFTLLTPPEGPAGTGPGVLGLAADGEGGVWARLRGPTLLRQHGRALTRLDFLGEGYTVVTAMQRGRDDGMLLTPLGRGVLHHRHGHVSTRVPPAQMPNSFVIAMGETSDGALWLGTRDAGLLRAHGGRVLPVMHGLPDRKINALQAGADGELWIATDRGVARWNGQAIVPVVMPAPLRDVPAHAMARDRDGNIWIGFGPRGLARVTARGVASVVAWDARARGDVTALFEDREGNLWIGTSRGLECLRDGVFRTFTATHGLPVDGAGAIFADQAGRVWMGPPEGGLYWLENGRIHRVEGAGLGTDVIYSLSGRGRDVWVGRRRGGLTRVRLDGTRISVAPFTTADGLAQDSVFAVHHARDGSVWAGTLSAGLSHYHDGVFTNYDVADGLASNSVTAVVEAADGSLWFGTPTGVSIRSPGGWRTMGATHGLPASDVTALLQDRSGTMWIGTSAGLAYVQGDRVHRATAGPLLDGAILGLAEDRTGRMWVTTSDRVLRIDPPQLRAEASPIRIREFGPLDGLASTEGVRRHRSVVADRRGSIWLSVARGLSQVDASRPATRRAPTTAFVDAIVGDDGPLEIAEVVQVPARTRRITVALAAASLSTPERVQFRYRLDGFDAGWSTPTAARQAAYTNLPPGTYDFRVMASDPEGTWTGSEASVRLRVAPAYWQTAWFQGGVMVALTVAGWGAYRMRLRQLARRMTHGFEARLAERTRIAQDLHDTLLQGCMSVAMQLHVAVDRLPEDAPARPTLERVVQLMSRVIDEGRAAVRGLRDGMAGSDALEQAFSRTPGELAPDHAAGFRVVVEGEPRPLHPVIRDEVYRVGREAIANALRHAEARHIEVEIVYTPAHLRLSVRDDGRGIDGEVLRAGRDGHWGLEGMRERAGAMGAAFRVLSRADAGTEVELVVPGGIAFAQAAVDTLSRWRRWRGRSPSAQGATGGTDRRPGERS